MRLSRLSLAIAGLALFLTFGCKSTSPKSNSEDAGTKSSSTPPDQKAEQKNPDTDGGKGKFTLTSPAFKNGGKIPQKYGCGPKRNYKKPSIPLKWSNPPKGTKSFVLLFDDLAPIAKKWVHWIVVDIPASVNSLPEGASGKNMPAGSKELKNTWGEVGYGGPCPPDGTHRYRIRLFAMPTANTKIDADGKNGDEIAAQLKNALGTATLEGLFP